MEYTAKCQICGHCLTCTDGPFNLGEHLLADHPEFETNFYQVESCACEDKYNNRGSSLKRKLSRKLSMAASNVLKKASTASKKNLYKTTVESWHPGSSPLSCPKCGTTDQPYIRRQRNKVAYNSLGAFFLLGCWPICFLPMLVSGGASTIVCCKKCGYCFGTYDKKKGQLIPAERDMKVETPDLC